jgi:hypothetical protein
MFVPQRKHVRAFTSCYRYSFTFLYVEDVRTSQETHVRTFTVSYGGSFTFLYVEDVRTSQETHVRAFTVGYGGIVRGRRQEDARLADHSNTGRKFGRSAIAVSGRLADESHSLMTIAPTGLHRDACSECI